jgi:hypothetical protein
MSSANSTKVCAFPECGRTNVVAKGFCYSHYEQQRTGQPLKKLCVSVRPQGSPPRITFREQPCSEWGLKNGLTAPCFIWESALDRDGYGSVSIGGKKVKVHRHVWEEAHGKIPKGLLIDHRCRVRSCINVDHLRIVTNQVNLTENVVGIGWQIHASKESCKNGHPFSEANTYRYKGGRYCRACRKDREASRRAKLTG